MLPTYSVTADSGYAESLYPPSAGRGIALFPLWHAGLSQAVEIMRHVIGVRNQVVRLHEGEREIRPQLLEFTPRTVRFIELLEVRECGDQHRMSRPLKVRLTKGLARPFHGFFVLLQEQVGVGHANQEGTHVRVARAQPDGVFQMWKRLYRSAGEDQGGTEAVMCPGVARVELECDLEFRNG